MKLRTLLAMTLAMMFCFWQPAAHAQPALGKGVTLQTRDKTANALLNRALNPAFWDNADKSSYGNKQLYDEIWLAWVDDGYMALITGEGKQNFVHEVVADIIIQKQNQIARYVDGAEVVKILGYGVDPQNGLDYVDAFYYLDFGLFYSTYSQRMYRVKAPDGRTILFFEQIDEAFTGAETWATYQPKIDQAIASVDRRSIGGSIVPVEEIFGMFIVSPGNEFDTRVTFIAKIGFSKDNWVASLGSRLRLVMRTGLDAGFNASVSIAQKEQERRAANE
ncbi:MAG: hypothetical protein AAFV53_25005 [Myxococcota bacterium]